MLKKLRNEKTQKSMANIFGVTQQAWHSWESGRTLPSLKLMQLMEEHFSVRKEEIFFGAFNYKT